MTLRNKPEYLYLHVPFCAYICSYCDFAHSVYRTKDVTAWLNALEKEVNAADLPSYLKTIYLGGGTPTCLEEEELEHLLSLLDPYRERVVEYTAECNPETLSEQKAAVLAAHGVNRVSIGFQSADERLLKLLGRHHTAEDTAQCIRMLRRHGIDNISLDLMYSLPGQTMEMLKTSVDMALAMEPKHLSLYSLTIEENTLFAKKGVKPLDEETEADMYEWICSYLEQCGYYQYEISNFARPQAQSLHNRAYWTYRDFYGISCGASGKEGWMRYDKPRRLKEYIDDPFQRKEEILSQEEAMFEMTMMNLRLKEGMSLELFENTFGLSFEQAFGQKAAPLYAENMLECNDGYVRCTEQGFALLNSILVRLM